MLAAFLSFRHLQQAPPPPPTPPLGESVPVTVTTAAPVADVRPAVAAPEPAPARSEAPEPSPALPAPVDAPARPAPPPPPTPAPKPAPKPRAAPPVETPAPEPKPSAVARPKPTRAKPTPELDLNALARRLPTERRAQKDLDLSVLAASLPRGSAAKPQQQASLNLDALAASLPAGGHRAAAAQRGPARAETAALARPAVGAAQALSGDVAGALMAKIKPRWNGLDCDVPGADTIVVRVRFSVDAAGRLTGEPEGSVTGGAPDGVMQAAARGAERAVRVSAPFDDVPPEQRRLMNPVTVRFSAAQSCRGR